ncbi:MAG: DUF5320 domain-containing protein [Bacteroidia bacterium]|nr:DUF5320 domain-containing protein [Bacteroidia bacterium]
MKRFSHPPSLILYFLSRLPVVLVYLAGLCAPGRAQDLEARSDSLKNYMMGCLQTLTKLEASHQGVLDSSYVYLVYAIEHQKSWTLLVADSSGYYSYTRAAQADRFVKNSLFFDNGLCEIVQAGHLVKLDKPKVSQVGDIKLRGYYQLNKTGKELYEQLIAWEGYGHPPGFWQKLGEGLAWPFEKVLNLDKVKNLKKTVDTQQKTLEDQKKALETAQKELEALQKQMEEMNKPQKNAACSNARCRLAGGAISPG